MSEQSSGWIGKAPPYYPTKKNKAKRLPETLPKEIRDYMSESPRVLLKRAEVRLDEQEKQRSSGSDNVCPVKPAN